MSVSIRAPYVGSGLLTIERDRVFHHQWFRTTTTSSVQRVTLPKEFEGNGYVGVQFLRDPSSEEIFMSRFATVLPAFPQMWQRAPNSSVSARPRRSSRASCW